MQGAFLPAELSRCIHFTGQPTGATVPCACNPRRTRLALYECRKHGLCTPTNQAVGAAPCCAVCPDQAADWGRGFRDPLPAPYNAHPPGNWHVDQRTIKAHKSALEIVSGMDFGVPRGLSGDGIIFCSDSKFHFQAALAIMVTRHFTTLPIQWWYVGKSPTKEMIAEASANVTFHDVAAVRPRPRICGGWQMKLVGILHSGFRRVLYLDADAYLVGDPSMLFDVAGKRRFVYWQDLDACERNVRWSPVGVDPVRGKKVPQVQGGHYCVDVATAWRDLHIAHWMDQHADFYYKHVYADQDLLRCSLAITGGQYHVPDIARWKPRAFVVGFPSIAPIIVHRCQGKLFDFVGPNQRADWLPSEELVWKTFASLKSRKQIFQ